MTVINILEGTQNYVDKYEKLVFTSDSNEVSQQIHPQLTIDSITLDNAELTAKSNDLTFRLLQPDKVYDGSDLALRLESVIEAGSVNLENSTWVDNTTSPEDVLVSLKDGFNIVEDDPAQGHTGLRRPQVGALHSVLGYWTTENHSPVTVVLPTGTGKTETMLSLYAKERLRKLLIVVPSDALRTQISDKFKTYGILQKLGLIRQGVHYPNVGTIKHKFTSKLSAQGFVAASNVIITTPNALLESDTEIWKAVTNECTHLFIDEAHHATSITWDKILTEFVDKYVVQFTATPYRNDGSIMKGKIIYNFPLKKAQEQGYFSAINYESVFSLANTDKLIASKAIEYLRKDIENGYGHILMARVRSKIKAEAIFKIYKEVAPDLNPVYIHSTTKKDEKQNSIEALRSLNSRILICVDMFGEGFDMPSLKVAAIHEPHRSLGVTLQFIGRFARVSGDGLGDATIIVNRGDPQEDVGLKKLYSEDSDWNSIITELADSASAEQEEINEFESGFNETSANITLRNLEPKMSTVVYKTDTTTWFPEKIEELLGANLYTKPIVVNEEEKVLWFVTKQGVDVGWGKVKSIEDTTYSLYLCYWNKDKKLLYINGSTKSAYLDLAKALCGDTVELIKDTDVFKTMASLKRRVPTNVGLKDTLTNIFQMTMGPSVAGSLEGPGVQNKYQTNIFAHGYDEEDGSKVSMGVSLKGRVWSNRSASNIRAWTQWCDYVGEKLTSTSISLAEILKGFIIPKPVTSRPDLVPLALEWGSDTYVNTSEAVLVSIDGTKTPLIDSELLITSFESQGNIPFVLKSGDKEVEYEVVIANKRVSISPVNASPEALIETRQGSIPFSAYVEKEGLRIQFEQQTVIEDSTLLEIDYTLSPFDINKLETIDWSGVDFTIESQGSERNPSSIQARAVEYLKTLENWDVVMDDDGSGETADLVAMKVLGNKLIVNLVHCKFSKRTPGARIGDFYEVCGQAQKSIQKRRQPYNMVRNLIRRERNRQLNGRDNIVIGTADDIQRIAENMSRYLVEFTVTIVQPGLSKAKVTGDILQLLAATESYISDVGGQTPLKVIVSN